jgi:RND family efflux transporter MFP subunit
MASLASLASLAVSAATPGCGRSEAASPHGATTGATPGAPTGEPSEPAGVLVTVEKADARAVPREVSAVGTLMAGEETLISAKVEGRVARVGVDIGDRVEPGRTLVELDGEDYEWAERQALHGLMETLATLGLCNPCELTQADPTPAEIPADFSVEALPAVKRAAALAEQARAEIAQLNAAIDAAKARVVAAEADLRNADEKLAYNTRLRKSGSATEQELIDAKTRADSCRAGRDAAVADRAAAEARLATARAAAAAAEAQAAATAVEMRARVAAARRMRTALEITRKSRRDGVAKAPPLPVDLAADAKTWVVAERLVSAGEFRKVAEPLVRLAVADVLKLRLRVPETFLNDIRAGMTADILTDATGSRKITGAVTRIRPVVDASDRHFDVEVRVANSEGLLKPGVFARARLVIREDPAVTTVPLRSVVSFAGVDKVFVVEGGLARDRPVSLGAKLGDRIEILSGVKPGETVVVTGQRLLADKSPVRTGGARESGVGSRE